MVINKKQFSKSLKSGDKVSDVFSIGKKNISINKKGQEYCRVELCDKEGYIDGILWPECLSRSQDFEEGDYVSIEGTVSEYNGRRQVTVNKVEPRKDEEIDQADFMQFSKQEISKMLKELDSFIKKVKDGDLRKLLDVFFKDNSFSKKFARSTAALKYHHAYIGGLLEHTLSVTSICEYLAGHYRNVDRDLVITGAILHDIGKVEEYSTSKIFKLTDQGKMLGHITIGYGMVLENISRIDGFSGQTRDSLLHIILSHHGLQEYGSPKCPKTLESFLVFHADHLDADIGGYNMILDNDENTAGWSGYSKQFQRSVLLKKGDKKSKIPEGIKDSIEKALEKDKKEKNQDGLF